MSISEVDRTVLISFSSPDRPWVDEFAGALRRRDIFVISHELMLEPGDSGLATIERALREADDLVFLVSGDPTSQPWLYFEFGVASLSGKRFIPIVPDAPDLSSFPIPMQSRR